MLRSRLPAGLNVSLPTLGTLVENQVWCGRKEGAHFDGMLGIDRFMNHCLLENASAS